MRDGMGRLRSVMLSKDCVQQGRRGLQVQCKLVSFVR